MINLLDSDTPSPIDLGKLQPAHPNLHSHFSRPLGEPALFVIDAHTFPFRADYMYALIDSLQQAYTLVLVARAGTIMSWVKEWEDYIGPADKLQLIIAQPSQLNAHMRAALQNQPDWADLLEPVQNAVPADEYF